MTIRLKPLAQQRIVITGATSGIGLATARAAVASGARVMLAARNQAALAALADELSANGGAVSVAATDVADAEAVAALAEAAVARFGGIDTWVNNAAAATFGALDATPIADQRRVFDVGYWGTVHGSLAALARLRAEGGAIINIGSVLSERAFIWQGPYSAMKHAVKGFTDALRSEVLRDGLPVSVTLIKPSAMHTPYPDHARNLMEKPAQLPPILYDPQLVARAVLHAAQHPRRELAVGGMAAATRLADLLAPGLMDRVQAAIGPAAQQTDVPPDPAAADNLYTPRADGHVYGRQARPVRRHSLWLDAQLHPAATALAMAGAAALATALVRRR